jgi:transcriptional regulator with XRE-family HTH domain
MEERVKQLKAQLFQTSLQLELAERGVEAPHDLPYNELSGILLKHVRMFRGLSETELARRSGVRLETISRLESGKHKAQEATVERLARALKVSPEQLSPDRVFRDWPGYISAVAAELREFARQEQARINREKAVS